MIVKMIQDLRNRMEKMQEMFTEDLEELKNKQRLTIDYKESTGEEKAEEQISDLEGRIVEITAAEQNIEERIGKKK